MRFLKELLIIFVYILLGIQMAFAQPFKKGVAPLFPVAPVISDRHAYSMYPSVAGDFLVYSRLDHRVFSVEQTSIHTPTSKGRSIQPKILNEAIRFGVALKDGAIGYVSNRMGPVSAWMRQAHGDGHIMLTNQGVFRGGMVPMNLHASSDGKIWCFDTSLEKTQQSRLLSDFADTTTHEELLGQTWRFYISDAFEHKLWYRATKTENASTFMPPSLFILDREHAQLTMIPNAFDCAISPDGRSMVFVRARNGNNDLWMQNIDGSHLTQLTDTPYGEFEPAWSPDGTKITFTSNRDSQGNVRATSIYIMDTTRGHVQRLTNAQHATDGSPTWQDAHTILFHSNRDLSKLQSRTISGWNIWSVHFKKGF